MAPPPMSPAVQALHDQFTGRTRLEALHGFQSNPVLAAVEPGPACPGRLPNWLQLEQVCGCGWQLTGPRLPWLDARAMLPPFPGEVAEALRAGQAAFDSPKV